MRIISGRFKGHRLVSFQADHIRPTTDRVKESVFNILQAYFDGSSVLDLFAGTGNLGIEALSRGAARVQSVESNKKSLSILKENLTKLKIADEVKVHPIDVFQFLKKYQGEAFDIIFIDPPFTQALAHDVMSALAVSNVFNENTWVIIESSDHERLDSEYSQLKRLDQRDFGDKKVSFFRQESSSE